MGPGPMGPRAHLTVSPTRIRPLGPWAQGLGMGSHLGGGEYMDPGSGHPYNARARNVRACPRARARGMNPRWRFGSLF